jgi:N-acetyl-gamma-glutamyl-phosphate reductase
MTTRVFVEGQEGTTGLKIIERLSQRSDVTLLRIDEDRRKDPAARQALINASDITFLCLPDAAARESVSLVTRKETCVIDASTAFRTHPEWTYGLPELEAKQRARIRASKRISVPGCHASAFVLSVKPLVAQGILDIECPLTCHSITGYSGGGKSLIAFYENASSHQRASSLNAPRPYALRLEHKHLPEMQHHTGLAHAPIFTPIVGNFYRGLAVTTYFHASHFLKRTLPQDLHAMLAEYYANDPFVRVAPWNNDEQLDQGFFDVQACNHSNFVDLFVWGNDERMVIIARLDNLGKGASGAAIQCMNLHLGIHEDRGLSSHV